MRKWEVTNWIGRWDYSHEHGTLSDFNLSYILFDLIIRLTSICIGEIGIL